MKKFICKLINHDYHWHYLHDGDWVSLGLQGAAILCIPKVANGTTVEYRCNRCLQKSPDEKLWKGWLKEVETTAKTISHAE